MSSDPIVIVAAKRTPLGAFQGSLTGAMSPDLGAAAIRACIEESGIDTAGISEVLMGCVLPAGTGQAPARQAAISAGLPLGAGCTTLNKVCGSGMKTTMLGNDLIKVGSANIVVAGGMESMTNAPYLMPNARGGYRMGHQQVLDHMFFAMAIALKSYLKKIADPADMASTAGVSFSINHIAAVILPFALGLIWIVSPAIVFIVGAIIACMSLALSQMVPSQPEQGMETIYSNR